MRNGKLVVAQIGCGKFAEYQDLPNIISLDQLILKWICDLDLERAGEMQKKFGAEKIEIGAQIQAQGFYEKCGFKVTDNEYVEDGIPHVMMYMQL